jgi:hypothetical protein
MLEIYHYCSCNISYYVPNYMPREEFKKFEMCACAVTFGDFGLQPFGVHRQTDRIYHKENNILYWESVFDT